MVLMLWVLRVFRILMLCRFRAGLPKLLVTFAYGCIGTLHGGAQISFEKSTHKYTDKHSYLHAQEDRDASEPDQAPKIPPDM